MKELLRKLWRKWTVFVGGEAAILCYERSLHIQKEIDFMAPILQDLGRRAITAYFDGDLEAYEKLRLQYNSMEARWQREVSHPLKLTSEEILEEYRARHPKLR